MSKFVRLTIFCLCLFALLNIASASTLEVGSGKTYTTLSSAIAAANDGDTIHVNPGNYLFTSTITITQNDLTIYGDSYESTVFYSTSGDVMNDANNYAMLTLNGVSGFELYGIKFRGPGTSLTDVHNNGGKGDYRNAIYLRGGCDNVKIHDCYFTLLYGDAVKTSTATDTYLYFYNNQMITTGHDGYQCWYDEHIEIYNNYHSVMINNGFRLANCRYVYAHDNTFTNALSGTGWCDIQIQGSTSDVICDDNVFVSTSDNYPYAGYSHTGTNITIRDSIYYNTPSTKISAVNDYTSINNTVYTSVYDWASWGFGFNANNLMTSEEAVAPEAGFSASVTSGALPISISFTDSSTNTPTNWNWNFGDGSTSTVQNPTHTYTEAGTYTVALVVTNYYGSDTETKTGYITVTDPAVTGQYAGNFSYANLTIENNAATNDFETCVVIDYREGMNSDFSNIRIADSSNYPVNYWIENYTASNNARVWFDVNSGTTQMRVLWNISGETTDESNGLAVFDAFDDCSGASLNSTIWSTSGTGTTTASGGTYNITGGGTSGNYYVYDKTSIANNYILMTRMKTNRWDSTAGKQFVGFGTGSSFIDFGFASSTEYNRYFEQANGSTETKAQQAVGVWTANTYGVVEIKRANTHGELYINHNSVASLATTNYPTGTLPPYYRAYNSGDTITVDWFAIRSYASSENTVSLGTTQTQTIVGDTPEPEEPVVNETEEVIIIEPIARFTANITNGTTPLTVEFTDTSINNATEWSWDFGDGNTSTSKNATHTYYAPGTYTVYHTAANDGGSDTIIRQKYIKVQDENVIVNVVEGYTIVYQGYILEFAFVGNEPTTWVVNGETQNETTANLELTFGDPGNYYISATDGQNLTNWTITVKRMVTCQTYARLEEDNYYSLTKGIEEGDIDGILSIATRPFTDVVGRSFYLVAFVLPFILIWRIQNNLGTPTILALIFGCLLIGFIPAQFESFIIIAITLAFGSALYNLVRDRA